MPVARPAPQNEMKMTTRPLVAKSVLASVIFSKSETKSDFVRLRASCNGIIYFNIDPKLLLPSNFRYSYELLFLFKLTLVRAILC